MIAFATHDMQCVYLALLRAAGENDRDKLATAAAAFLAQLAIERGRDADRMRSLERKLVVCVTSDTEPLTVDDVVDTHFATREAIFKHVGYVEDWRYLPIQDNRERWWAVDKDAHSWCCYSSNKAALEHWLATEDFGPYGKELYETSIYTQRHLPKWVFRGEQLALVVEDTQQDQNQWLGLYRIDHEIKTP